MQTDTGNNTELTTKTREALEHAIAGRTKLPAELLALPGMSGRRYRMFLNNLAALVTDARYLEVGVWKGSTLCSAIYGNSIRAFGVDNWSEYGGPAAEFLTNLARFKGTASVSIIESDFRQVNFAGIGKFNIFFFDGPHTAQDQHDGIMLALPGLDERFVLIVDDWNWQAVREGTQAALKEANIYVDFGAEIRTTNDNSHPAVAGENSDWHNGYFIATCSKPA